MPTPCLILDTNLNIVAANEAYLRDTMTSLPEILGLRPGLSPAAWFRRINGWSILQEEGGQTPPGKGDVS